MKVLLKRHWDGLSLEAETLKDLIILENLKLVDKYQNWKDLLVYLQKKYENV